MQDDLGFFFGNFTLGFFGFLYVRYGSGRDRG
jgi:hypothetical protein